MANKQFIQQMAPLAQYASQQTGVKASVILAQWGIESAWGTSKGFKVRNNVGGISYGSATPPKWSSASRMDPRPANEGGYYMVYNSLTDYVKDYIVVMNNSRYDAVRAAGKTEGLVDDARALGYSGYAAGQYKGSGGIPGDSLISTIRANQLWTQDSGGKPTDAESLVKLEDLYKVGSSDIKVNQTGALSILLTGAAAVLLMGIFAD